jgi:hypothetical protein
MAKLLCANPRCPRKQEAEELLMELEGDGSLDPDPVKSLGLRKCLELQRDEIAQLKKELEECTTRIIERG